MKKRLTPDSKGNTGKPGTEACEWLKINRCPHCVHLGHCKGYMVTENQLIWHCRGYRSRHWDERSWA